MFSYRPLLPLFVAASMAATGLTRAAAPISGIPPSAAPVLAALPTPGAPTPDPGSAHFDFGRVEAFKIRSVHHLFALRNVTTDTVVVASIQTSCDCTGVAVVPPDGGGRVSGSAAARPPSIPGMTSLPYILPPGRELLVDATVDLLKSRGGKTRKFIWVMDSNRRPAATLELSGVIESPISFDPPILNFRDVPAGTSPSLDLKVTIDRSVLDGGDVNVFSTNANVRVIPLPASLDKSAAKAGAAPEAGAAPKDGDRVLRTYSVTLSKQTPIGRMSGSVGALVLPTHRVSPITDGQVPTVSWFGQPALVFGKVVGPVSATPDSITFGIIRPGANATHVILLEDTRKPGATVTAKCDAPWLTATLAKTELSAANSAAPTLPPTRGATGAETFVRRLEVTVDPSKAPAGAVNTQITLKWSDGITLILPVTAIVVEK